MMSPDMGSGVGANQGPPNMGPCGPPMMGGFPPGDGPPPQGGGNFFNSFYNQEGMPMEGVVSEGEKSKRLME